MLHFFLTCGWMCPVICLPGMPWIQAVDTAIYSPVVLKAFLKDSLKTFLLVGFQRVLFYLRTSVAAALWEINGHEGSS